MALLSHRASWTGIADRCARILLTIIASTPAAAHAVACDRSGTPLTVVGPTGEQYGPLAISDGVGGAVTAFLDDGPGVPAQRVSGPCGSPSPGWPATGGHLTSAPSSPSQLAPDGAGGAFAGLQVGYDIYLQHMQGDGTPAPGWPTAGVPVCTATGPQFDPAVVADGSGGAFVTWWDRRLGTSNTDIYLQYVTVAGTIAPGWPTNGLQVSTSTLGDYSPQVLLDGSGGAIVLWLGTSLSASRITANAQTAAGWPVSVNIGTPGSVLEFVAQSDGQSGAYVAWIEELQVQTDRRVRAQRILANGQLQWAPLGAPVSVLPKNKAHVQMYHDADGMTVCWLDQRDPVFRVFAQRLSDAGTPLWAQDGLSVNSTASDFAPPRLIPDGTGGVLLAWVDARNDPSGQIFAQHLDANGSVASGWPDGSFRVTSTGTGQDFVSMVPAGIDACLLVFHDRRNGPVQLFTQGLGFDTPTDLPNTPFVRRLVLHPNTPNPFNPTTLIRYDLPYTSHVVLRVYDVSGRWVRDLVAGRVQSAGPHQASWNGRDAAGGRVGSGVYLYRLEAGSEVATRRMVLVQ